MVGSDQCENLGPNYEEKKKENVEEGIDIEESTADE